MQSKFTVGIEEEFQIVDAQSGELRSSIDEVLASGHTVLGEQIKKEMFQHMVEVGTEICDDIACARQEVSRLRCEVNKLAQEVGGKLVASGTHPFASWLNMAITQDERYLWLAEHLQQIGRSIAVYGLHVHVGVDDRDRAIELMNEARYFLPHMLALSVNSPFWEGRDTGIKSYRSVIWGRMPRTGIPDTFSSWDDYSRFVEILLKTNSIDEPKKIWWDIRPHPKFKTLEFRVCDMPTRIDVTLTLAALFQALIAKLSLLRSQNLGFRLYKRSLIAENRWRALRHGIDGDLVDFGKAVEVPMRNLALELLEFVDDVVDDLGSRQVIEQGVHSILREGTGADQQLAVYGETRDPKAVVDFLARETMRGVVEPAAPRS